MTNYLGKSKIRTILKELGYEVRSPKEFRYVKTRGDEIYECDELSAFFVRGKALYLGIYEYDEESGKMKEVDRKSYHLKDGMWINVYSRKKAV